MIKGEIKLKATKDSYMPYPAQSPISQLVTAYVWYQTHKCFNAADACLNQIQFMLDGGE